MQDAAKNLLLVLVALFPIVDPIGGSPFFLVLTSGYTTDARKALSWRIAVNSFLLLIGSYFVGTYILDFFGISLTVGPGSISVAITLGANAAHRHPFHPLTILAALIGLVLIAVSIFLCYGFAERLGRMIGPTGMTVITQLSSFFLVCIGVQITWNGMKELMESVTLHIG